MRFLAKRLLIDLFELALEVGWINLCAESHRLLLSGRLFDEISDCLVPEVEVVGGAHFRPGPAECAKADGRLLEKRVDVGRGHCLGPH